MEFQRIFNNLLDTDNYRVHLAKQAGATKPLDVLTRSDEEWASWQKYKERSNGERFPREYVISFAQINGDKFVFGGIFRITDRSKQEYDVELTEEYKELIGRVVIKYTGDNKRGTVFTLDYILNNVTILEVYPKRYMGETFVSLDDINHAYSSLEVIFKNELLDWKIALSNAKGIYLLTDKATGKQYIGSAYGENGFWGRWSHYIYGLHGDNKELKKLVENEGEDYYRNNFHFTILEVVGSYLTDDEIIKKESKWKEKLFTREFGYNAN